MTITYRGDKGQSVKIESLEADAIVKEVAQREHVDPRSVLLTCGGVPLEFCDLAKGGEFSLAILAEGGKKGKKKKKNYTTPKHVCHKKKKVKLAVLRYYSVEGDTVTSLRSSCLDGCPAGIKMAKHKDRLYCGRCHYMKPLADKSS